MGYVTSQFVQGARLAGYRVTSNLDSLQTDGRHMRADLSQYGVEHRPQPREEDFIVIDETRQLSGLEDIGESFFSSLCARQDKNRLVLIYSQDDANFVRFPEDLTSFVTHQIQGFSKSPWSHPVPFGFTLEGFKEASMRRGGKRLAGRVIQNFNPTYSQSVRETVVLAMSSIELPGLMIDESHCHGSSYSEQLSTSGFCLAVGGVYHWPKTDYSYLVKSLSERSKLLETFPDRARRIGVLRWDSFRFWEAMAFGCIPIHLDFDLYGFHLPEKPLPWVHYVPLDLSNISRSFEQISELAGSKEKMSYMSEAARIWAQEHLHPTILYGYIAKKALFIS